MASIHTDQLSCAPSNLPPATQAYQHSRLAWLPCTHVGVQIGVLSPIFAGQHFERGFRGAAALTDCSDSERALLSPAVMLGLFAHHWVKYPSDRNAKRRSNDSRLARFSLRQFYGRLNAIPSGAVATLISLKMLSRSVSITYTVPLPVLATNNSFPPAAKEIPCVPASAAIEMVLAI